ncbi:MAG TPA: hypothetical protein VGY54_01105, partial [Polyangiaceae bacterium]|nr:hypothetical protein [Polyangiaceae bacterium]
AASAVARGSVASSTSTNEKSRRGARINRGTLRDGDVRDVDAERVREVDGVAHDVLSWRRTGPAAVRPVPGCEGAGSLAAETD